MLPLIGAAAIATVSIKWASSLPQESRTRLLNSLNQFSAAAGVLSRILTAVDSFRVVVEWTDQWPRYSDGKVIPGERLSPPPIGVPAPVSSRGPSNPAAPQNPASPKQGVAMTSVTDF